MALCAGCAYDDGGGVSGNVSGTVTGPPPALSGQQQIPPIYYNPATYAAAGAPVGRGISASSIPTYVAAPVPTFAAKGGPIGYRRGGGVMRYEGGGDIEPGPPGIINPAYPMALSGLANTAIRNAPAAYRAAVDPNNPTAPTAGNVIGQLNQAGTAVAAPIIAQQVLRSLISPNSQGSLPRGIPTPAQPPAQPPPQPMNPAAYHPMPNDDPRNAPQPMYEESPLGMAGVAVRGYSPTIGNAIIGASNWIDSRFPDFMTQDMQRYHAEDNAYRDASREQQTQYERIFHPHQEDWRREQEARDLNTPESEIQFQRTYRPMESRIKKHAKGGEIMRYAAAGPVLGTPATMAQLTSPSYVGPTVSGGWVGTPVCQLAPNQQAWADQQRSLVPQITAGGPGELAAASQLTMMPDAVWPSAPAASAPIQPTRVTKTVAPIGGTAVQMQPFTPPSTTNSSPSFAPQGSGSNLAKNFNASNPAAASDPMQLILSLIQLSRVAVDGETNH